MDFMWICCQKLKNLKIQTFVYRFDGWFGSIFKHLPWMIENFCGFWLFFFSSQLTRSISCCMTAIKINTFFYLFLLLHHHLGYWWSFSLFYVKKKFFLFFFIFRDNKTNKLNTMSVCLYTCSDCILIFMILTLLCSF